MTAVAIATLTARELEVLRLVARGMSDREIGRALGITEFTARNHQRAIREKTGLHNRTQLTVLAIHAGVADPPALSGELFAEARP
jgi:two-component system nitrate/nitrite response regulator NarL